MNSENLSVTSKQGRNTVKGGRAKIANDKKSIAQGSAHKYVRKSMLNPLNDELERRSQFGRQADTNHGVNKVSSVTNVF